MNLLDAISSCPGDGGIFAKSQMNEETDTGRFEAEPGAALAWCDSRFAVRHGSAYVWCLDARLALLPRVDTSPAYSFRSEVKSQPPSQSEGIRSGRHVGYTETSCDCASTAGRLANHVSSSAAVAELSGP